MLGNIRNNVCEDPGVGNIAFHFDVVHDGFSLAQSSSNFSIVDANVALNVAILHPDVLPSKSIINLVFGATTSTGMGCSKLADGMCPDLLLVVRKNLNEGWIRKDVAQDC